MQASLSRVKTELIPLRDKSAIRADGVTGNHAL